MSLSPFLYNLPTPNGQGRNKFNFPTPTRTPYDIVKLGDFTFPGISHIEIMRSRKAKVQAKKKGKGDKLIDSGLELANIKISTRIFTDQDFQDMEKILDFFETKVGKGAGSTANSFALNHPSARMRGVYNIFIESIDGPIISGQSGYADFMFTCKEVIQTKDQSSKVQKPSVQGPIQTSTPLDPSFAKVLPSQDPAITQPNRTKPK